MPVSSSGPQQSNLTHVNGVATPSTSGRAEVIADTVNDKTGYSLTAGSYSIRASSVQRGSISVTSGSNTASISSVTTTRAPETYSGAQYAAGISNDTGQSWNRIDLTDSTTVTATRNSGDTTASTVGFVVPEFF